MTDDSQHSEDIREPHLRDRGDFLGVFGVIERADGAILFVQNRRKIDGAWRHVWDLPGGQVEPGELLHEALARELREELTIDLPSARPEPELLFLQEGERIVTSSSVHGRRAYAWRSFFFGIEDFVGEPRAASEVSAFAWLHESRLGEELDAPYHTSFLEWLRGGRVGSHFRSSWRD